MAAALVGCGVSGAARLRNGARVSRGRAIASSSARSADRSDCSGVLFLLVAHAMALLGCDSARFQHRLSRRALAMTPASLCCEVWQAA